jgi:hypothetical protein
MSLSAEQGGGQSEPTIPHLVRIEGGNDDMPVYRRGDGHIIQKVGGGIGANGLEIHGFDHTAQEPIRAKPLDFFYPQIEGIGPTLELEAPSE